ncbi:TonB-dependent receptor [Aquimarina sediminis]|uniref:TonB-dependent receptor n=1 Tax=Aquimarina sediminis TaxID=2070536 RepID=UPI000CA00D34|nr:TonB-dependent receptor [Aquimarina sediminis]
MKPILKKNYFFLILLSLTISTTAQTLTQTVKGKVLDATTGRPLLGATITLLNIDPVQGTITDEGGFFTLEKVPVGRQSFICSFLGYEDSFISEVLVGSAKEIDLTIRLVESLEQLNEVLLIAPKDNIKPNNRLATVSARSFSVEETKRFPASISDPGRMALSFAGVTNSDDATNEIIIRGNAPNQLLWKIEGVEIPEPNHFSEEGYSPGAVSLLSTNMLGKSDFFTGAFPAEYGNALSGVFDINLRSGNTNKGEYAFQLGVLGADLSLEGPFSKNYKGSYLVNYRYSTLTLLNEVIEVSDNSVPEFQDLSFKINLPISSKTNVSIWGIGGISNDDQDNKEQVSFTLTENEQFNSKTYMGGINLKHFLSNKSTLDAALSYSGNESDYEFTRTNTDTNISSIDRDLLKNNALRFNLNLTNKFNPKATLKTGAILSYLNYDVFGDNVRNNIQDIMVNEEGNGTMIQAFAQAKYRFNKKLSSTFGFHSTYFSINEDFTIEPRAGIEYKITPKHTLSAGVGIHSRRMPLNQYFVKTEDNQGNIITPNEELDLMRATHYIFGYDWRIIKNGHIKIEAYYQDLNKVAIVADPNSTDSFINGEFIDRALTDTGKGRNYGLELTFEKFFSKQYYFLTTASFFNSKYKAANGNWYNSRYNYNYTFNVVGGKEFSVGNTGNNIIGANAKVLLNGGKRGTPVDLEVFDQSGSIRLLETQRNTIQFKDYLRLDTSVYYRINRPKVAHIISLDVQNLTNRNNVDRQVFDPYTRTYRLEYQLNLIPLLNYRIEF